MPWRTSGALAPEYSKIGADLSVSTQLLELSVSLTADGIPVCFHDYGVSNGIDRVTTPPGGLTSTQINAITLSELKSLQFSQGNYGPGASTRPSYIVPLDEMLERYAGTVVFVIEAKDQANAYTPIINAVTTRGLGNAFVYKGAYNDLNLATAKAAGYPVYAYFTDKTQITFANVNAMQNIGGSGNQADILGVPIYDTTTAAPVFNRLTYADLTNVMTAVPHFTGLMATPVHRRQDIAYAQTLGIRGAHVSDVPYLSHSTALKARDIFGSKSKAPGDIAGGDPTTTLTNGSAPIWSGVNELQLTRSGQHAMLVGSLSPVINASGSYTVKVDFSVLGTPTSGRVMLAFAHDKDNFWYDGLTPTTGPTDSSYISAGNQIVCDGTGSFKFQANAAGSGTLSTLGTASSSAALVANAWNTLTVNVTPTGFSASLLHSNGNTYNIATVSDTAHVGRGYLHLGKTTDVGVSFRNLVVS